MVNPGGGNPPVPWFANALANLRFLPTLTAMFVLGATLGLARPRRWLPLCCSTASLPLLFWGINFVHDVSVDPTSHNLFPFEVAIVLFLASPALAAGCIGSLIRRAIRCGRTSRCT
jgi:hypothetical protein